MYRIINASDIDSDYDPFHGKKYRFSCDKGTQWVTDASDDPIKMIRLWFMWSQKYPMECAIMTKTRSDGVALLEAASEHLDELYDTFKCPYKYDYLKDEISKKIEDGCKYLMEGPDGDQIHPFSFG